MSLPVLRHVLRMSFRSRRTQVVGLALLGLTVLAAWVSAKEQDRVVADRIDSNASMRAHWVGQGEKNPHSAAHYGNILTRPRAPLAGFDDGMDRFVGQTVFLEAHRQHDLIYTEAADFGESIRFGVLSPAAVLSVLLPLALIFMGFDWIALERQRDTLRLHVVQGVSTLTLVFAKAGALWLLAVLLATPAFALLLYHGVVRADHVSESIGIVGAYAAYLAVVAVVIIGVASLTRQASVSLLVSLALWFFGCIVLPRTLPELARTAEPPPTRKAFAETIQQGVRQGIDGHNPRDRRTDALRDSVLKAYGVTHVDSLPVNWSGIVMDAGERYTDRVYDQVYTGVQEVFAQQDAYLRLASFVSPYLAVRGLSMGLAGTAPPHQVQFARAAEQYRRVFVAAMNADLRDNMPQGIAYDDFTRGETFWSAIPAFQLPATQPPGLKIWLLGHLLPLCCWLLFGAVVLWAGARAVSHSIADR